MDTTRRHFLKTLTMAGGALALAPVLARAQPAAPAPAPWTLVGKAADFAVGQPKIVNLPESAGGEPVAVTQGADGKWTALSAVCTHKGCTVGWAADAKQYVCPCHRARFDAQGQVLRGPARRPLPTYAARANADGTVSVQLSA